jgi:hypothetical protein
MTTNANCSQIANTNTTGNLSAPLQDGEPTSRAAWVSRAKAALAVPREVVDTMTNFTDDQAVLYRWRDEMADLIEEASRK